METRRYDFWYNDTFNDIMFVVWLGTGYHVSAYDLGNAQTLGM